MTLDSRHHVEGKRLSRQSNVSVNSGDAHYDFIRRDNDNWSTGLISMQELYEGQEPLPEIMVVFFPDVADIVSSRVNDQISNRFKIPAFFWTSVAQDASGFFGCQDTRDVDGGLESFSSHFRFLIKDPVKPVPLISNAHNTTTSYVWYKLGLYTTWTPFKNVVVLCFGLPPSLRHSLSNLSKLKLEDPFSFHTILVEQVVALYDTALWSWRDRVRDLEKNRNSSDNPKPDYVKMHEIARHTIHSTETLAIAIETMTSLIQEHEIFFAENPSFPPELIRQSKQTRRAFRSQIALFKCLHLRSKALEGRLQNEINLAFNTVAQHDSRIAVQIGEATQIDSAAMKTISVLGLAFFPGTFICALFSTAFFSFSPGTSTEQQKWAVSQKFWIYWAVAIPVTALTVACWVTWQRGYKRSSLH